MRNDRTPCVLGLSRQTLSAWRDGLLPTAEMARISAHVQDCATCQRRLNQFERIAASLQRQPTPDLRAQTWRGLQARLSQKEQPTMRLPRVAAISSIGASVVLALIVILFIVVFNHRPGGSTAPAATTTTTATATVAATPTATASPIATTTVAATATTLAAPDCSGQGSTFSTGYYNTLPDPGYKTTNVFANIPLPPLSRIVPDNASGGLRGYGICSAGTVPSITAFMTDHLTSLGWADTGGGAWKKNGYGLTVNVSSATFWTISWHDPDL